MPATTIQNLISKCQLTCNQKNDAFSTLSIAEKTEQLRLKESIKLVFLGFERPAIDWTLINNEAKIKEQLLLLEQDNSIALGDFEPVLQDFLDFIKTDVLQLAIPAVTVAISDINMKTMDALKLARTRITNRKNKFNKDLGIDLNQDSRFITIKDRHEPLAGLYRKMLKEGTVNAKSSHLAKIKDFGLRIKQSSNLDAYFKLYSRLTDYLNLKTASA